MSALWNGIRMAASGVWIAALAACPQSVNAASLEDVVALSSPAIVVITSDSGQGSGVLLENTGIIVTNLHVLEGASDLYVTTKAGDRFDDVSVIDFDAVKDLALIKIKGFDLPTAKLGNSNSVRSGQPVYAIGAPLGYEQTISSGIVSAIRPMDAGFKAIQTDAAISPGSSGGGLFNADGELVGILTAYEVNGQNINFALPINYARGMLGQPVTYSEDEFLRLNVASTEFGEDISPVSEQRTVELWLSQLQDEFDSIAYESTDDGDYVVQVEDLVVLFKLYDDLLWMFMPVEEEQDFTKSQLESIASLSTDINYAYLSVNDRQLFSNFEMAISSSNYTSFRTYFLSVLQGAMTASEEIIYAETDSSDVQNSGIEGSPLYTERLPAIGASASLEGLRIVEPANLGITFSYKAFLYDYEDGEEGSVTFQSLRGEERWVKIFVEELDYKITDANDFLIVAAEEYIKSLDLIDLKRHGQGMRKVQGHEASWLRFSGTYQGMRIFWSTTIVYSQDRLTTLHAWAGKDDMEALDAVTVEFFENARF